MLPRGQLDVGATTIPWSDAFTIPIKPFGVHQDQTEHSSAHDELTRTTWDILRVSTQCVECVAASWRLYVWW